MSVFPGGLPLLIDFSFDSVTFIYWIEFEALSIFSKIREILSPMSTFQNKSVHAEGVSGT
jgi:hypothetical protein